MIGGLVLVEGQRGLGAGPYGVPDAVGQLRGRLWLDDLQLVIVIEVEDLRGETYAHAVGLADQWVDPDLHDTVPLYVSLRWSQEATRTGSTM
jgi:hypothetical protein